MSGTIESRGEYSVLFWSKTIWRVFACVCVFGLASLLPHAASASRVTPMILDLEPTGRDAVGRVELTNDGERDIPYEVQMMKGDISPEGQLSLAPADDQFVVFPPQAIVEARSQQVFRIQYVGEEALDRSQVYYLSVKQIPVEFERGQNQVQVVVNYNVLVNVVPDNTEPMAVVRSADFVERQVSTEGLAADEIPDPIPTEKGVLVELANDGTRYFYAGTSAWEITGTTVSGEPFRQRFARGDMTSKIGVGVVAPLKSRSFFFALDEELQPGTVAISVDP